MDEDYKENIDELISSGFKEGTSVLFVGPEIIKADGKDYNELFYESISDDPGEFVNKSNTKYNKSEKIWTFDSSRIKRKFFQQFAPFFESIRDVDSPFYYKLAAIPFPLIISLIPDNTLEVAFSKYKNFDFSFRSFKDSDIPIPEPTEEKMLIYNIYGNIKKRNYVNSHFDYLNFILEYAKENFPGNLTLTIQNADFLVFIGFEFDKWYNILLLYILNLITSGTDKYAVEEQSASEIYKRLSDNSLNVLFIDENHEIFISDLYQKARDENLLRELIPEKEFLMDMIKSNQETIIEIDKRLQVTTDPLEKRRLEMDKENLKKDNEELKNKLKNL